MHKDLEKEMEREINLVVDEIVFSLKLKSKIKLKIFPVYNHFGIGLYIRNNYIYNNKILQNYFDHDELSEIIYERVVEKLNKVNN